ncbi:uncharacterized protein BT62DRAFT_1073719 [Guyanagaster necrorhizus]|uniref:Uncharacterized protein n=1 Tax=Guyanagaster necrorhizus TaxID=856835 RepID=A0A9P7VZ55_9AGAR|nr:uncharacterized protein BT62DRAFT_1073719 [Guyanagaster necrorhizus MCA 3950]KAG7449217.1 hypothetical protein BT62DRAFT_1073719 [Guyanagaster necrorhizus MCA 3950]
MCGDAVHAGLGNSGTSQWSVDASKERVEKIRAVHVDGPTGRHPMICRGRRIGYLLSKSCLRCSFPIWPGAPVSTSIGNILPGGTHIEVLGPYLVGDKSKKHVSVPVVGNLAIVSNEDATLPLFFINRNNPWQSINETAIFPVILRNVTTIPPGATHVPLQLALDTKHNGVDGGSWKWRGPRLHYHHGAASNGGTFYSCPLEDGSVGLFLFLQVSVL